MQPRRYLGRFLEIAESAPNDPAAVDALIWVVTFGFDGPEFSRAIDRLAQNHAERRKVGHAALTLADSVSPSAEKLLRAVIEKNPDQYIKGLACLALGRYLKHQSERVRDIRDDPKSAKAWEAMFLEEGADKESFARFIGSDPDALMKEAEAMFERIDQGVRRLVQPRRQAEQSRLRQACQGCPGRALRDPQPVRRQAGSGDRRPGHRRQAAQAQRLQGQGGCRRLLDNLVRRVPRHERVRAIAGEEDARQAFRPARRQRRRGQDKLREWIKKEEITWPSWRDGNSDNAKGPISRQFNVHGWPTLYILDHRGIIRHKFLGSPGPQKLDAAINALVEEAEKEAARSKKN